MDMIDQGPKDAPLTVALAHGAGAAMDTPFMDTIAAGLAADGWRVVRFEFPYMAQRRTGGSKRPPDRQPVLLDTWRAVVADLGDPSRLVIGGKSMGGRMASLIADEAGVGGLVCLGYPFHPPGKPDRLRTAHLETIEMPTLICQGTRDTMGGRDLVAGLGLSPAIRLHWAEDGDHSLKPRKSSGRDNAVNLAECVTAITDFLRELKM
ncbi:hypothetical protein C882_2849 [Caenispirillum salinarum AK4]|uniref:KANL3/Tex30 alpha/beta hydrolase-like domain-containing protein n=1 Tax=Caenispirillum salinarum AK4 TaxID=1238182 RepID=K9HBY5_9PROT|nr:alpha/beta family hydrolase [Caenispirillum salinarum]EKV26271.1 hypothetical protein C882_2849 [Caenispirillum salinarum AK4]